MEKNITAIGILRMERLRLKNELDRLPTDQIASAVERASAINSMLPDIDKAINTLSSLPSDSEIEKAAEGYANTFKGDNETVPRHASDDFTAGVFWLRSQLNTGTSQNIKP